MWIIKIYSGSNEAGNLAKATDEAAEALQADFAANPGRKIINIHTGTDVKANDAQCVITVLLEEPPPPSVPAIDLVEAIAEYAKGHRERRRDETKAEDYATYTERDKGWLDGFITAMVYVEDEIASMRRGSRIERMAKR